MSRGYWRIILAIIGVIALVGLSVETSKLYDASEQRHPDYRYQPASHPSLGVNAITKAPAKPYQPDCENPNSSEDADLCAQWASVQQVAETNRMGSLSLRFTLFSLWATVIATAVLLWTLIESRLVSRRELRAYLFVDGTVIGDGTHHPDRPQELLGIVGSVVGIKSSGSTPAHRVAHFSAVDIALFKDEAQMRAPIKLDLQNLTNVPPSGLITADRRMTRRPTQKMIAAIKSEKAAVFVYGAIEYLDVFDKHHRTDYRLFFTGSWPPPLNHIMRFSNSGNEAT